MPSASPRIDFGLLVGGALVLLVFAGAAVLAARGAVLPAEDAAMLFAYASNLADSGVISFYPGGPPTEGATDFLFMVALAALRRLGLPPAAGAGLLTMLGALVTFATLHRLAVAGATAGSPRLRALQGALLAILLAGTSFLLPALTGFSVYVFLAPIALMVLFHQRGTPVGFFAAALCTCLVRPDGVVVAGPLAAALLWRQRHSRRAWLACGLLLLLPGLAYFLWRWSYFGALMPLPFYVKTAGMGDLLGIFHLDGIRANYFALSNPVTLILLAAAITLPFRRLRGFVVANAALLATIAAGLVFYAAIRQEQNVGLRFQAPIYLLMIILFLRLPIEAGLRLPLMAVAALAALPTLAHAVLDGPALSRDDNVAPFAAELRALPRGTMLVTEAGMLPYRSGWIAIDSWGLNTAELSRRVILPEDVERYAPDLIVVHTYDDLRRIRALDFQRSTTRSWENQARNILLGADGAYDTYFLPIYRPGSASYRRQPRHDLYLVRKESPLAAALRALIAAHDGVTFDGMFERLRMSSG